MILDRKGKDHSLSALDGATQIFIKAIFINTFAANGTFEAAQTASLERILSNIDDAGLARDHRLKSGDHIL